jgi:mannitol-1-phosphate/altronate dehydrogenase
MKQASVRYLVSVGPEFLLQTIQEQLEKGGPIIRSMLVVAAWCRYLELAGIPGYSYDIQDSMSDVL